MMNKEVIFYQTNSAKVQVEVANKLCRVGLGTSLLLYKPDLGTI